MVGTLNIDDKQVSIFVENTAAENEPPLWQFSSATVDALAAVTVSEGLLIDKILPEYLEEKLVAGVPLGHWLVMILIILLAYGLSLSVIAAIHFIIRKLWIKARTEPTGGVIRALELPFRLYLAGWVFVIVSQEIGLSIIVRQRLSGITVVIGFIAFLILLFRLTDFISAYSVKRMTSRGRVST